MSRSSPQKCLRIPPQICLKIPPQICLRLPPQICLGILPQICLRIPPQILSENTTSKKILGVQPQIVFKNTTAKCLRVWPLIMSGIPPQFLLFFSYIYNCSPWLHYSFMLLDWGLDHGVTLLIYVLFPLTVCGVREMGGVEVGGEDFSVSVSSVC